MTCKSSVSIVIPAYNAERSITASIASAQALGFRHILVIDDGSVDATAAVALEAGATVVRQANAGASAARAAGIALVDSEFVILLDADDRLSDGVAAVLEDLASHPDAGVCAGGYNLLRRFNRRVRSGRRIGVRASVSVPAHTVSTAELLRRPASPWPPCCAIWRTRVVREAMDVQGLPAALRPRFAEDYELLIRVSMCATVRRVAAVSADYAPFGGKSSSSATAAVQDAVRIQRHYSAWLGVDVAELSKLDIAGIAGWRAFRGEWLSGARLRAVLRIARSPRRLIVTSRWALVRVWVRVLERIAPSGGDATSVL